LSDIDFAGIRESAIASLEGAPAPTPSETPAPAVTETPTPAPVATSTPEPKETPAQVEARKWKLKDPEGDFEVDETELTNGHLRFRDYTRKTQAVAGERKQLEQRASALTEREQKINALLSDPQNVAQYYEFLTGQKLTPAQVAQIEAGQAPTPTPNAGEVATLEDAQRLARTQADQVKAQIEAEMLDKLARTQQWTQQQIFAAQAQAEMQRNATQYQSDITTHIDALAKEMPLLTETYDRQELEDLLCRDVMKAEPKSVEEAKNLLVQAAKDRHSRLDKALTNRQKAALIQKETLQNRGIEPPGGATPGTPAVKHKLGDKALTQSAIAFMESYKK
jgi:hypothetical protein